MREPVGVHAERLVVAQEGAVEVLTVKENGDLHHACSNGKTVLIVVDDPRPEPATRPYQKIRSKSSRCNPPEFHAPEMWRPSARGIFPQTMQGHARSEPPSRSPISHCRSTRRR